MSLDPLSHTPLGSTSATLASTPTASSSAPAALLGSPANLNLYQNGLASSGLDGVHAHGQEHGHGHANGHQHAQVKSTAESLPNMSDMDTKCGGCKAVIDQESGGVVVAFG
jgi:hypothetical protein